MRKYRRKAKNSYIDVTACSANLLNLVDNWKVVEDLTSSDHNGVTFDIHLQKYKAIKIERATRKYNTRKANWAQFNEKLGQLKINNQIKASEIDKIHTIEQLATSINKLTEIITKTCNDTIPKKSNKEILTLPWWSEELASLKKGDATRKSRIRCAVPVRKAKVVEEYLKQKEKYELEATKVQVESWRVFYGKQDRGTMGRNIQGHRKN